MGRRWTGLLGLLLAVLALSAQHAAAVTTQRYATVQRGGLQWVGNTLGFDKAAGVNTPGTQGSIGAFAAFGSTSQVPGYPVGTTLDWKQNASMARLNLPTGSRVLYAALIWSGSYKVNTGTGALYDPTSVAGDAGAVTAPINFTTPLGLVTVTPTSSSTVTGTAGLYYFNSADVTSQVRAAGNGQYVVGRVVGTVGPLENGYNTAGWTLAVAYSNASEPVRAFALYTANDLINSSTGPTTTLTGFRAKPTAPRGKLFTSAWDGDANATGDQVLVGPTAAALAPIAGPNNPIGNFFASQINNSLGALDTTGWPGSPNHAPGAPVSGARQGRDVTTVPLDAYLTPGQTQLVIQPRTNAAQDLYGFDSLGVQVDVASPIDPTATLTADRMATWVGDTVTYTTVFDNTFGTVDALNVIYKSAPPPGMSFVPNSMYSNGVWLINSDPTNGVPLGTLDAGNVITLTYKFKVDYVRPQPFDATFSVSGLWSYDFRSAPTLPLNRAETPAGTVTHTIARLEPKKTASPAGALAQGAEVTYTVRIPNTGTAPSALTTLRDPLDPLHFTYVPGSTTLNGIAVADVASGFRYATAHRVNSPGQPTGVIAVGAEAVLVFRATKTSTAAIVENTAFIDPDGPNPGTEIAARVVNPATSADLAVTLSDGVTSVTAGLSTTYTITVTNNGPNTATLVNLIADLPPSLLNPTYTPSLGTYDRVTGRWTGFSLPSGASMTMTLAALVDPWTLVPVVNRVTINSAGSTVPDPIDANNTAMDTDQIVRVADLSLTKTQINSQLPAGEGVTYTLNITNNGPTGVNRVRVVETPDPTYQFVNMTATVARGYVTPNTPLTLPSTGTLSPVNIDWTAMALAPGETLQLYVTVLLRSTGGVENRASVAHTDTITDPNMANNTAGPLTGNAANRGNYKVYGFLYNDFNHNGIKDAGEGLPTGLPTNVYMKARQVGSNVAWVASGAVATTGQTPGAYTFINILQAGGGNTLPEGTPLIIYPDDNNNLNDIVPLRLTGWIPTYPRNGELTLPITVYDMPNINFGYFNGSRFEGTVFLDDGYGGGTAADGVRQLGETLMGGVTITGSTATGTVIHTTTTDTSGRWELYVEHAYSGQNVRFTETNPPGFVSLSGRPGGYYDYGTNNNNTVGVWMPSGGTYNLATDTSTIPMVSGRIYQQIDYGDGGQTRISGTVYHDANFNGTKDPGEVGLLLPDFVIKVFNKATGAYEISAVVDPATGNWSTTVSSDTHYLIIDNNVTPTDTEPYSPPDWVPTERPTGMVDPLVVAGIDIENINFGFFKGSKVSGRVFDDSGVGGGVAQDGLQNGGEAGLAGVSVQVLGTGDVQRAITTTNVNGDYLFWLPYNEDDLVMKVREFNPAGYVSVSGSPGNTGGTYNLLTDTTTFTMVWGSANIGINFGDSILRSLSGFVYNDRNYNATREPDEAGLDVPDLFIKLFDKASGVFLTSTTVDPVTGAWAADVGPGTYFLIIDDNVTPTDTVPYVPPGWVPTQQPTGIIDPVVVAADPLANLNFGFFRGVKVTGRVFEDSGVGSGLANDGLQNGGEPGLGAVTIHALGNADALRFVATTDAAGDYVLWLPYEQLDTVFKVQEFNPQGYLSISGSPGTTGGAYDLGTDRTTFTVVWGTVYSGVDYGDITVPTLVQDNSRLALPGTVVQYMHTYTSGTAGVLTLTLSSVTNPTPPAWSEVLYQDVDGNGVIDPADPIVVGPISVVAGQIIKFILQEAVPPEAAFGATNQVTLLASLALANTGAPARLLDLSNLDTTTVDATTYISLVKAADKTAAGPGEEITYTLTYTNDALEAVDNLVIRDMTPAYTTFVSATFETLAADLTDCTIVTPVVGEAGEITWTFTGTLQTGATGTVTFKVKVDTD